MKFSCKLSEIIVPLGRAAKFAQKGSQTADTVTIEAVGDRIAFSAQNFASGGRFWADVTSNKPGKCAVNAAALSAFCSAHSNGETVEFHTTEKNAIIVIGGGKATLALNQPQYEVGPSDQFPQVATVDSASFLSLLGVSQFADTNLSDSVLNNIYLAMSGDRIYALAGSSVVFAHMWVDGVAGNEFSVLLPASFASLAGSLIGGETIDFRSDEKRVGIVLENGDYFYSALTNGNYPAETILGASERCPSKEQAVIIDADKLKVALNSVLGFARFGDTKYRRTNIKTDGDSLLIESYQGNEIGNIRHSVSLEEVGSPLDIFVDAGYIGNIVQALERASKNPLLAWADEHKKSPLVYLAESGNVAHIWGEQSSMFVIALMHKSG